MFVSVELQTLESNIKNLSSMILYSHLNVGCSLTNNSPLSDFKTEPKSQNYILGTKITLTCAAPQYESEVVPTASWLHNGESFEKKYTVSSEVITEDPLLYKQEKITWTADKMDYTGQYQCNMTYNPHTIGKFAFTGGTLIGGIKNIIIVGVTELSVDTYARKNTETSISCRIKGDAQATWVRWYKKSGETETQVDSKLYTTKYSSIKLETKSTVTWEKATAELSGKYICKGLYSAGTVVSSEIELK